MKQVLKQLFEKHSGLHTQTIIELGPSGSSRRYFRIHSDTGRTAIGVAGSSAEENKAFIEISKVLRGRSIPAPQVFAVSEDGLCYIQEDLGDQTLYNLLSEGRESGIYSSGERELLRKTIALLPVIQFETARTLDFSICYPEPSFGERTVMFDLNYFKYCFLKPAGLEFQEARLQDDFEKFSAELCKEDFNCFMYRDFQSRNVMIKEGSPYFIDFQGGRKGPFYYDLASFLWQARSRYPEDLKAELIDTYISAAKPYLPDLNRSAFLSKLRLYALFRSLQVLGAYGFRGWFERKQHFIESVPYAIANIKELISQGFTSFPYLTELLGGLCALPQFALSPEPSCETRKEMLVSVCSFSYRRGIPADSSGNGGGYVFDCRSINNPGRIDFYRRFNGRDPEVIKFLEDDGEINSFLSYVHAIVDEHLMRYIERGFTSLQICFGCTGGQHRSVYSAQHVAEHIAQRFGVRVRLLHRELGIEEIL